MLWLDKIPWAVVFIFCLTLGLAPFFPEPHIVEKIRMLTQGKLARPIDIFDLVLHAVPFLLLFLKLVRVWIN
ncbi:MAG: hypothetical protein KDB03_07740 [Planctomycetales bacterium]|nr:hypothetical protein [Planctomycetales bacterium]